MAIITLTSDWGLRDHYAAAVKGAILKQLPDVRIVDISHEIPVFNLNIAAYIIRNFYPNFPTGTVHILGVSTEASIETPHTLVFHDGHYFIGADNGIFSLIFDEKPQQIIEIDIIQDSDYFTFPSRDVFVKAACHIISGKPMSELGHPKNHIVEKISFRPVIGDELIRGKVIYVDNYENAIINITEKQFKSFVKSQKFAITFKSAAYRITEISNSYQDVPEGEMLALFNTSGLLEIAINKGNAFSLLGLKIDTSVTVELE
jgi:S-adenosylmethionine hydrolase